VLKISRIPVLVSLGVGLAFAGCGSDDDESGSAPPPPPAQASTPSSAAQKLELTADQGGALKYDKTSLSADAGTVEIVMSNPSQIPHNVVVEGNGVDEKGPVVQKDGTSTVSADLTAGTYEFYCSVGKHRDAGMKGTLTVR
jgi:plastocyanin